MVTVPTGMVTIKGSGFFEVGEYFAGVLIGREYWIEDFLDSALANDEAESSDAYWRD